MSRIHCFIEINLRFEFGKTLNNLTHPSHGCLLTFICLPNKQSLWTPKPHARSLGCTGTKVDTVFPPCFIEKTHKLIEVCKGTKGGGRRNL